MKIRSFLAVACLFSAANMAFAGDFLVRFRTDSAKEPQAFIKNHGGKLELVSKEGLLYKWTTFSNDALRTIDSSVAYIEPNHTIRLFANPSIEKNREFFMNHLADIREPVRPADNPEIQTPGVMGTGTDPLVAGSWGLGKVNAQTGWTNLQQGKEIIVAVTDTGVDYNHADLIHNMWRNAKEIPGDGIDNDANGYTDDIVGWDFAVNDNKPFDLTLSMFEILLQGGNPGHGTHVAGVIGSRLNNGVGVAGIAPQVKIMALRFITEKGQGTTDSAIKAIDYAVNNGALVINASWGGEAGEEDDSALKEAIQRAQDKGVIFVAAAGNGRANPAAGTSAGFDNDTDAKPMVPASFNHENIMAVAATDDQDALAGFSNWGKKTVDVAAPGVKIMSTVPGSKYQDTVIDLGSIKATWDGTSMAAPHVAGALAAIWSSMPTKTWKEVYGTLLSNAASVPGLSTKVVTGGRLDLKTIK